MKARPSAPTLATTTDTGRGHGRPVARQRRRREARVRRRDRGREGRRLFVRVANIEISNVRRDFVGADDGTTTWAATRAAASGTTSVRWSAPPRAAATPSAPTSARPRACPWGLASASTFHRSARSSGRRWATQRVAPSRHARRLAGGRALGGCECVGTAEGLPVGTPVGRYVGVDVGTMDGFEVGAVVGVFVGALVGFIVGSDVGREVGSRLGLPVGSAVGSGRGHRRRHVGGFGHRHLRRVPERLRSPPAAARCTSGGSPWSSSSWASVQLGTRNRGSAVKPLWVCWADGQPRGPRTGHWERRRARVQL